MWLETETPTEGQKITASTKIFFSLLVAVFEEVLQSA